MRWRRRADEDFRSEIEAHIAIEADRLVAEGLSPAEAREAAVRRFGNRTSAQERFYESRRPLWLDRLRQDLRVAVRSSRRSPGVTLAAVVTLALGIGATTAIVSSVDAMFLRPLPYADPDRLVLVWEEMSAAGFPRNTPAPANYLDWLSRNRVFEDMAATVSARANLTGDGPPERVLGRRATANFFAVLGVRPLLGRTFTDEEDRENAPVVVISHSLWRRRHLADPSVVGTPITMNGAPFTVIGVMPESFVFCDREMEFWSPIAFTPAQRALRGAHVLNVVARLVPGVDLAVAREHMTTIAADLAREYPENERVGVVCVPIREEVFGDTRQQLMVLSIAALCLLLLMCANLANLLLARAATRRHEMATRAALGAIRTRLVSHLMVEGILWSLAGGLLGIAVALGGIEVLKTFIPTTLAESVVPQLDGRFLIFAIGLSLFTGFLFSIIPALSVSRLSANEALKETASATLGGRRRARSALIVVQVAATCVLLMGAGLMLRNLLNMRAVDVGFRVEGLLTLQTVLPDATYDDAGRVVFYNRVLEGVRGLPGVRDAGFTSTLPFLSRGNTAGYRLEGLTLDPDDPADALFRVTTNDYLRAVGVILLDGRLPAFGDVADSPPVVVVNESFAERYWPNESAVGHRLALNDPDAPWMTIVGVVRDVRETGYERELRPGMYVLASQVGRPADNLVVRVGGDPMAIASAVRQVIAGVDPEQPVAAVRSMEQIVDLEVVDRRQQSIILAVFATIALLLAFIGLYGLVSHAVSLRSREAGLRMALGATTGEVKRALVKHGLVLSAGGLALGVVPSLIGTRIMRGLLFGVQPEDPFTFMAVVVILVTISAVACWLPAGRVSRIHPMVALRQE